MKLADLTWLNYTADTVILGFIYLSSLTTLFKIVFLNLEEKSLQKMYLVKKSPGAPRAFEVTQR